MANSIPTLACPSCGSKVQIIKGTDYFACAHCGHESSVRRERGSACLDPIAADIDHTRGGVIKTTAASVVIRLSNDLNGLENDLLTVMTRDLYSGQPATKLELTLLRVSTVLFLVAIIKSHFALWSIFMVFFLPFLFVWIKRDRDARQMRQRSIQAIKTKIARTRAAIERNRSLV